MNSIKSFCEKYGLRPDMYTLRKGTERFISEMEAGLNGTGSLKMIPAYIDPSLPPDFSQKVIVIDAGGTNLRIALVSFTEDARPVIEYFENHPMLGTNGQLTADEFFDGLAGYLEPVAGKADKIGFCFSYPAEVLPTRDARILHFTKEVRVSGAEGRLIGEGLRNALRARGLPCDGSITVLNDTVAALLGGISGAAGREFDSYAGIILGTGTNTCYIEKSGNIKKDSILTASEGNTVVNLESGGYAHHPRSTIDDIFDAKTETPGTQLSEKMIAGAYAGSLFLEFVKAAALEGCFSEEAAAKINIIDSLTGREIDEFCDYPYGTGTLAALAGVCDQTRESLYILADAFFERVAMLVTVNLAAILIKSGKGKKPYKPVCVSAEGTTFYKARLFKPKLDFYMESYVRRELGLNYSFVKIEDCIILGTAAAGLIPNRV